MTALDVLNAEIERLISEIRELAGEDLDPEAQRRITPEIVERISRLTSQLNTLISFKTKIILVGAK